MGKNEELSDAKNLSKEERLKVAQSLSFGFFDDRLIQKIIHHLNDDQHYQFSEGHQNINLDEESKNDSGFDESS